MATVFDIEADDLLKGATKMHVLSSMLSGNGIESIKGSDHEQIKNLMLFHIENKIPVIAHNGISYDVPLIEKLLGIDLSELMVIDTLMLSWALNPDRPKHGLESFGVDYGIPKVEVDDWENLTYEEYEHRCVEDVKINSALWDDLKARLIEIYTMVKQQVDDLAVGGARTSEDEVLYIDRYVHTSTVDEYIDRYLTFLMYKGDSGRLREKTQFLVDVPHVFERHDHLESECEAAKAELETIMPEQPIYAVRNLPKNPRKKLTPKQVKDGQKQGDLSVSGKNWNKALENIGVWDHLGNELTMTVEGKSDQIKVLTGYKEANANSTEQIKKLLFSKGWQPRNFKFVKDDNAMQEWVDSGFMGDKPKPRAVAQVTIDGDGGKVLCPSVELLAEESPEIHKYANYGMLKHRFGLFKGFIRDMDGGEHLQAQVGGYTNTLRDKHRVLVNLPQPSRPYGADLRGSLIAGEGNTALGSDLCSLEDRIKHMFMMAHDPDYVNTMMADDYDPHIQMALTAGLISQEEFDNFKKGEKTNWAVEQRRIGKKVNYVAVYGGGAEAIARDAGVSKREGKNLHTAYWELNWSVKAIAEEQCVIVDSRKQKWLINPINGFAYSLRTEKDRFSTLAQGTGSFFFDRWVDNVLTLMQQRFGVKRLSAAFHDEFVAVFKDTEKNRTTMEEITHKAIEMVNEEYGLRRKLACDVAFGKNYSEIH